MGNVLGISRGNYDCSCQCTLDSTKIPLIESRVSVLLTCNVGEEAVWSIEPGAIASKVCTGPGNSTYDGAIVKNITLVKASSTSESDIFLHIDGLVIPINDTDRNSITLRYRIPGKSAVLNSPTSIHMESGTTNIIELLNHCVPETVISSPTTEKGYERYTRHGASCVYARELITLCNSLAHNKTPHKGLPDLLRHIETLYNRMAALMGNTFDTICAADNIPTVSDSSSTTTTTSTTSISLVGASKTANITTSTAATAQTNVPTTVDTDTSSTSSTAATSSTTPSATIITTVPASSAQSTTTTPTTINTTMATAAPATIADIEDARRMLTKAKPNVSAFSTAHSQLVIRPSHGRYDNYISTDLNVSKYPTMARTAYEDDRQFMEFAEPVHIIRTCLLLSKMLNMCAISPRVSNPAFKLLTSESKKKAAFAITAELEFTVYLCSYSALHRCFPSSFVTFIQMAEIF